MVERPRSIAAGRQERRQPRIPPREGGPAAGRAAAVRSTHGIPAAPFESVVQNPAPWRPETGGVGPAVLALDRNGDRGPRNGLVRPRRAPVPHGREQRATTRHQVPSRWGTDLFLRHAHRAARGPSKPSGQWSRPDLEVNGYGKQPPGRAPPGLAENARAENAPLLLSASGARQARETYDGGRGRAGYGGMAAWPVAPAWSSRCCSCKRRRRSRALSCWLSARV